MRKRGAPVPAQDTVRCSQCTDPMDARAEGNAEQVRGYRVNRAQGGANMIALQEHLGVWLCADCLRKRRDGAVWDQLALWED